MRRLHIAAGCIGILGLFLGLCSLFGVVVSAGEAWREHVQKSWPQATAGIEHCRVEYRSSDGRPGHNMVGGSDVILVFALEAIRSILASIPVNTAVCRPTAPLT